MPELHILAGPNGTGKTTYYNTAVQEKFISPELTFLNADNICRDELGGYSEENATKAEAIVRERIREHIQNGWSFMIESNLAAQTDYDWIENMNQIGYTITLFFLCTTDVEVNVARVQNRIKEGGHPIPEAIIRQRYSNGLMYLKGKLHTFSEAILIDNTKDAPENVAIISNGKLTFTSDPCPAWANNLLFIIRKLAEKNNK